MQLYELNQEYCKNIEIEKEAHAKSAQDGLYQWFDCQISRKMRQHALCAEDVYEGGHCKFSQPDPYVVRDI